MFIHTMIVALLVADKAPTYGELILIDFLESAEAQCLDSGNVNEILCSKVKEAYPNFRIVRPKRFYDTVKNIAAPVRPSLRGDSKLVGSELSLYRERKWVPRIRNPPGRVN